jgi:peroxiredoxin
MSSALVRYGALAGIVIVLSGVFTYREFLSDAQAEASTTGVIEPNLRVALGQPAPDFVLQDARSGALVSLSDFRGRIVVLNFWATWCPPCRAEMPEFQRTFEERGDNLVVLAVDFQETDEQVRAFLDEFGVTFPVVMDRDGKVRQHYGVLGLPGTFFIDREGIVRGQNYGPVFGDLLSDGIAAAERAGVRAR